MNTDDSDRLFCLKGSCQKQRRTGRRIYRRCFNQARVCVSQLAFPSLAGTKAARLTLGFVDVLNSQLKADHWAALFPSLDPLPGSVFPESAPSHVIKG